MKKKVKKIIGILLSLALLLSLMPCMSLTVHADGTKAYAAYDVTTNDNKTLEGDALTALQVNFNGMPWYIIEDNSTAVNAGTVTLLAKNPIVARQFDDDSNVYKDSTVKGYLEGLTTNDSFADVANAIVDTDLPDVSVTGAKLWLLSTTEASALSEDVRKCDEASGANGNFWWLRPSGNSGAPYVSGEEGRVSSVGLPVSSKGGVRPALKLNLSKVYFSSTSREFTFNPYASLVNTTTPVKFNGIDWYIIADNSTAVNAGTVTLLAKNPIGASKFDESSKEYKDSDVKEYLEGLTTGNGSFADVANAIVPTDLSDVSVTGAKLWLLSISEAKVLSQDVKKCNQATGAGSNFWWLRSPKSYGENAAWVYGETGEVAAYGYAVSTAGGVRPALKLDLEKVVFDSGSKTFSLKTSLGTGAIINPTQPSAATDPWKGNYVYYGKYDGTNPTKYRVLDKASNDFGVTGGSLLLDCDSVLYDAKFDENTKIWADSDVKEGLNGDAFLTKNGNFTDVEKGTIVNSNAATHDIDANLGKPMRQFFPKYTALDQDKVFLLDFEDVLNVAYGYYPDSGFTEEGSLWTDHEVVNHKKNFNDHLDYWWLRSPDARDYNWIGNIDSDGRVNQTSANYMHGVSPAFNVSLSSVIFSSLVSGTLGQAGAEYKLTLKDPDLTIAAGAVDEGNNKYRISYDITNNSSVSTPTQVSVVVTNGIWDNGWSEGATIRQYTKLDVASWNTSGTGTFTLDSSITGEWGTAIHVYVLAEDVNAGNATDYASEPLEIKLPSYGLKFVANGGSGLMASENVWDNDTFTFPACDFTAPTGKTFDYWDMTGKVDEKFYSGDNTTITNACAIASFITVTAHWKLSPASVTTAPTAKTLTYNGSAQELVTAGTATGGAIQYAIGTDTTTAPTDGWITAIPTGTNVGTYYVWYKAKGDSTHSDSAPVPLTVTIKKKSSGSGSSPGPSYTYYTVKFEMNGHGEQVSSQTVRSGLKAKRPQDPTAEEYYFAGWFEDAELTTEYDFSSAVKKNMTLYARWEEIRYTVSFDLKGHGSNIETQWVRKNGMAEKPDDPSEEGFTFGGWYIDPDCTKLYDFSTPVTKDITVYAKWVKDVSIYRLYNPNSGAHLFTSNGAEKDSLVVIGWEYEGVAWTAPASSNTPVYRVYNPNSGEHHYTMNAAEKDILVTLGWNDEGICWYSDEKQGTPLYRLYNPNATGQYAAGAHHYTKDVEERDYLIAAGWNDEGIGWYGK